VIRVLQLPAVSDPASQLLREEFPYVRQFTKVLKGARGRSKLKRTNLFDADFVIAILSFVFTMTQGRQRFRVAQSFWRA